MSSLSISTRPSATFNWADDDEDDWNIEDWKATADTSAPTSLPPLQVLHTKSDDEATSYTVYIHKTANEAAPWISTPPESSPQPEKQDPSTIDWRCSSKELVWRAIWTDSVDLPAYPELSGWDNGVLSAYKRVNYSHHFQAIKLEKGCCGPQYRPFQCRISKMRDVVFAETENVVELTPATTPKTEKTGTDIAIALPDEGYFSEDSPPISPTLKCFNAPWNIAQIGTSPATSFVKKFPRADVDSPRDVSPVGEVVASKAIFTHISDALASVWVLASGAPWTTIGTIAAGVALGGAFHLARRR